MDRFTPLNKYLMCGDLPKNYHTTGCWAFKKMPDHCPINFLTERDKDRKPLVILVPLYPGNALTIPKLTNRFIFSEWLKVVWYPSLLVSDEKTPPPILSGKEQLPYLSERSTPTCPASRKLDQSSRNVWSLLSSDPSYWSEKKRKMKNSFTRVSALCWPLFFKNNSLGKKLHHCNAGNVIYNTISIKHGGCLLFLNCYNSSHIHTH